jgi:hypothetical protein
MKSKKTPHTQPAISLRAICDLVSNDALKNAVKVNDTLRFIQKSPAFLSPNNSVLQSISHFNRLYGEWNKIQLSFTNANLLKKLFGESSSAYKGYVNPLADLQKGLTAVATQPAMLRTFEPSFMSKLHESARASGALAANINAASWISALESIRPFADIKMPKPVAGIATAVPALLATREPFELLISKSQEVGLAGTLQGLRQQILTEQILRTILPRVRPPSFVEAEHAERHLDDEAENIEKGFLASVPSLLSRVDASLPDLWLGACQALKGQWADWTRHAITSP